MAKTTSSEGFPRAHRFSINEAAARQRRT